MRYRSTETLRAVHRSWRHWLYEMWLDLTGRSRGTQVIWEVVGDDSRPGEPVFLPPPKDPIAHMGRLFRAVPTLSDLQLHFFGLFSAAQQEEFWSAGWVQERLKKISFASGTLGRDFPEILCRNSSALNNLLRITLAEISAEQLRGLYACSFPQLGVIEIQRVQPKGGGDILRAAFFGQLVRLDIPGLGDEFIDALTRTPNRLHGLNLGISTVTDRGIAQLVDSGLLKNFSYVDLSGYGYSRYGVDYLKRAARANGQRVYHEPPGDKKTPVLKVVSSNAPYWGWDQGGGDDGDDPRPVTSRFDGGAGMRPVTSYSHSP